MPKFMSCLSQPSGQDIEASQRLISIPGDSSRPVKADCIFCNVSLSKGFNVVYEDDHYIAFKDQTPGAMVHLLIIPRHHHVSTVLELRSNHIPMLRAMRSLGLSLAKTESSSSASTAEPKMGFHIPPFSSVHHLHLHVLVPPYKLRGRFKYPDRGGGADLMGGARNGVGSLPSIRLNISLAEGRLSGWGDHISQRVRSWYR